MSVLILTKEAKDDAAVLLPGKSVGAISRMVRGSAPITHKLGNRRHKDLIFRVLQNQLVSIGLMDGSKPHKADPNCVVCEGEGKLVTYDECDHCYGIGCKHCDQGEVKHTRPCPQCVVRRK